MLSDYKNLICSTEYAGKIWIVRINRIERANAIDGDTAEELADVFSKFDKDEKSCVAILTGEGKYFCSGADLKQISQDLDKRLEDDNSKGKYKMNEIDKDKAPLGISRMILNKPVIAAINGAAVAGGFELILWCDLRVTFKDCDLGVYCRRFGVPLIDGGTYRLPALIGLSRAMDIVLTGRPVKGAEAYNIGLVNRLVDKPEEVVEKAIQLAEELADFPHTCLRNDRMSLLSNSYSLMYDKLIYNEFDYGLKSLLSKEAIEGSKLFTKGKGKHGKPLLPKF